MDEIQKLEAKERADFEYILERAKIFAKSNCKQCYGKGYNLISMVDKDNPNQQYLKYCHCVNKNLKKYQ